MNDRSKFDNFPLVLISEEVEEQIEWIKENSDEDQDAGAKFVLVEVAPAGWEKNQPTKLVFRATISSGHSEIFYACRSEAAEVGLFADIRGGGKFFVNHDTKSIYLWGRSMDSGQADYAKAAEVLRTKYPDYYYGIGEQKPMIMWSE